MPFKHQLTHLCEKETFLEGRYIGQVSGRKVQHGMLQQAAVPVNDFQQRCRTIQS